LPKRKTCGKAPTRRLCISVNSLIGSVSLRECHAVCER
jgi:hypothetical protein